MAARAEQNRYEAFRIALEQIKALNHLSRFWVLNLLHLRLDQIEHDKLAAVIGFKESPHNIRAIACALETTRHLCQKRINLGRFQRAGPIVIPEPKYAIREQCCAPDYPYSHVSNCSFSWRARHRAVPLPPSGMRVMFF